MTRCSLNLVEVSGTNQYSVRPLELVSTCVPLIVVLSTEFALALEAGAEAGGLLAPAAGVLVADEELLELRTPIQLGRGRPVRLQSISFAFEFSPYPCC